MHRTFFIVVWVALFLPLKATDFREADSLRIYQHIEVSYGFGGQIYNNNFLYNPGYAFRGSFGMMISESVGFGIGIGHEILRDEKFIPVYLETIGYRKCEANSPFVKIQAGYSIGWYTGGSNLGEFKYKGGLCFDAGIGRKFPVAGEYSVTFQLSYRHQFASMEYRISGTQQYAQALNYDMIVISLGLHFNQ